MSEVTIAEIKSQKNFYRDNFHRMVNTLFISTVIIAILIGVILFGFLTRTAHSYYATATNGNLVQINSVSRGIGLVIPPDQQEGVEQ